MKVLIHHSEIALKGKNRYQFENQLLKNIKEACTRKKVAVKELNKVQNRIIGEFSGSKSAIISALKTVHGIQNFSITEIVQLDERRILEKAAEMLDKYKNKKTMAADARRAVKTFPLNSRQMNEKIGDIAVEKGFKIDLEKPEVRLFVEILKDEACIYTKKIQGYGGLPVGSSGKILCLLSGGIDSTVAPFLMMKRGCRVDFLHFYALRSSNEVMASKIRDIVFKLNDFQFSSRLFIVPYHKYQLDAMGKFDEKYDVVVFKNFMLRLAEKIADENGYYAIMTGDSLGQVASQTLENLVASSYGLKKTVLRPLIGFNKQEIINLACQIGTFADSIREYKDCCSIIARSPATRMSQNKMEGVLQKLDIDKIISDSLEDMQCYDI